MIQNNFFSHLSTLSVRNNFLHLFSYIVYAIFSVITSQICCSGRVNSSLKSGESYSNMKKSIVVSIIEKQALSEGHRLPQHFLCQRAKHRTSLVRPSWVSLSIAWQSRPAKATWGNLRGIHPASLSGKERERLQRPQAELCHFHLYERPVWNGRSNLSIPNDR